MNECIYIPHISHIVSRRFTILIREIKFDVTWSCVKRQTAKITSGFVFFSSNPSLNHIKIENCLLLFATNTNEYFRSTVQGARDRRQKFHFCRLPFDVRRNVKLNLSNEWDRTSACKGASGCRYQFLFDLTHPPNPCMKCTMKLQIDHHTGNYVSYSFRQVCGIFNVPC